ncbi:MAG: D-glycero-beta-D-manno-heptose 1,7-bisphosphate 7-phosphatase [Sedimenticola thiotaurini]|uniref:D,D-heptose 1,7-bisphosphate phosphatase n=1 Tax=Sedimenticola thiotaurini TaxID=1543721 RepID=A0A558DFF5_9GAMM|nr:MAG: D-glycero-beta-D-manno-heptose 1,7-bisphosphate 7-phosphatase [Sedimenticola thiotaurini]
MKLVILDRDGVINEDSDEFIKTPEEWLPIPGSLSAIARLNQAGYRIVIATNQSGLGRGLFSIDQLNAIHRKMLQAIVNEGGQIHGIFFCPHAPKEHCECRKPKPGLFHQISERFYCNLSGVPCIGDSLRDLQAASAVGGQPILVRTGKGQRTENDPELLPSIPVYNNLTEAVDALLFEESTN